MIFAVELPEPEREEANCKNVRSILFAVDDPEPETVEVINL
jgi:hypothetical protein